MSKKYIHYGHTEFRKEMFTPIRNRELFVKPWGGLWASPVDAGLGWEQWCKAERFHLENLRECFTFTLANGAKVLHIFDVAQLEKLPQQKENVGMWCCLDFEQLLVDGYDAVELHLSEETSHIATYIFGRGLYWSLYGWDCDSILVMNPEVIVV